jgi:hypothetical protein
MPKAFRWSTCNPQRTPELISTFACQRSSVGAAATAALTGDLSDSTNPRPSANGRASTPHGASAITPRTSVAQSASGATSGATCAAANSDPGFTTPGFMTTGASSGAVCGSLLGTFVPPWMGLLKEILPVLTLPGRLSDWTCSRSARRPSASGSNVDCTKLQNPIECQNSAPATKPATPHAIEFLRTLLGVASPGCARVATCRESASR